jgi:hypothetical protein
MQQRFVQARGEFGGPFRSANDSVIGGDDQRSI